jgi:protein-S-isoprenylcysteine O-methyltransferase Ste14
MIALRLTATLYRISVEERVLVDHFGEVYLTYRKRTKGLIPGIV